MGAGIATPCKEYTAGQSYNNLSSLNMKLCLWLVLVVLAQANGETNFF